MRYSAEHEPQCMKVSKGRDRYWTTDRAKLMFGTTGPDTERDLVNADSPRWKQRALYDAMRDITALHGAVKLARVSVYDTVGEVTVGRALDRPALLDRDALRSLITCRTLSN